MRIRRPPFGEVVDTESPLRDVELSRGECGKKIKEILPWRGLWFDCLTALGGLIRS